MTPKRPRYPGTARISKINTTGIILKRHMIKIRRKATGKILKSMMLGASITPVIKT